MKQEASTYLGLSGDGAAAKGVGVADALEAANSLGLLRFLNDRSLHTAGVHVSTELSKLLSATSFMHSAVSAKQYLFTWLTIRQPMTGCALCGAAIMLRLCGRCAYLLGSLVGLGVPPAVLVEGVHHHPLDGVQAQVPDEGPDPGHDHIVAAPAKQEAFEI